MTSPGSRSKSGTPGVSSSDAPLPLLTKISKPFVSQDAIDKLRALNGLRGPAYFTLLSQAFRHINQVGQAHRFPMKTITMALLLFQRLHLYNKSPGLQVLESAVASLFVASKIEDTPRKARELLVTSISVRNLNISSAGLEDLRLQVLGIERQILETIGFDFRVRHPHQYVIKISKEFNAPQQVAEVAWSICTDAYLTDAPLKYPSHVIALASIILAAKLYEPSLFPLDSKRILTPRLAVNRVLVDLLEIYTTNPRVTIAGPGFGNSSTLMKLRMDINKEIQSNPKVPSASELADPEDLRDPKLSDYGTVRYLLEPEAPQQTEGPEHAMEI